MSLYPSNSDNLYIHEKCVTIQAGDYISDAANIQDSALVAIRASRGMTQGSLTFRESLTLNGEYFQLFDVYNNAIGISEAISNRKYAFGYENTRGASFLKIECGARQSKVVTLTLTLLRSGK